MVFSPMRTTFKSLIEFQRPTPAAFSAVVVIVALSRVSVFEAGSYFALPFTPSMAVKSPQFSEVTFFPPIRRL